MTTEKFTASAPEQDQHGSLALVMGGGGARAAYQVGFLRQLARDFPDLKIPILTGVSAGSINAAILASSPDELLPTVERMAELWEGMSIKKIWRSDPFALSWSGLRWGTRLLTSATKLTPPTRGLVNTKPLRRFLNRVLQAHDGQLPGIEENIRRGRLKAFGLTTTNYSTGQSITWVQGEAKSPLQRPLRRSLLTRMTVDHVMASCALPLFFPAIKICGEWYGDGGVRLTAPLSPALHLGAQRILAISTRYHKTFAEADRPAARGYPSPATILGVLSNAVFLDMLDYDVMTMQRINQLLRDIPEEKHGELHPVEVLLMRPSRDLEAIAGDYEPDLPKSFRFFIRGLGTRDEESSGLVATLLFAPDYIRKLMEIGEEDARTRHDELAGFLAASS